MGNQVTRTVYYYKISGFKYNKEGNTLSEDRRKINDALLELYDKQENEGAKTMYREMSTSSGLLLIIDNVNEFSISFKLVLCRRDILPVIEQNGNLSSLSEIIDEDQNVAEITHCVFFRDTDIIGIEYNFSGARANSVIKYLRLAGYGDFKMTPLINDMAYKKFLGRKQFTLFDLEIKTNTRAFKEFIHEGSTFGAIKRIPLDADSVEVIFKKKKKKNNDYAGFDNPLSDEDTIRAITDYRGDIKKFKLSNNNMKDAVDLLSDKVMHKVSVIKTEGRVVCSSDLYAQIKEYYREEVEGSIGKS